MRKLPIAPVITGFWSGVMRGTAASNEAFEPHYMDVYSVREALISDREAIRGDAQKAERQILRSRVISARTARAS